MKNMTLENVAYACRGTYYGSLKDKEELVEAVTTDSRTARKHHLFVPLKGARVDGHDFIEDVTDWGAFVLSEKELPQSLEPYILVDSTTQALKDLAEFYLKQLDVKVVGIIGSVGKTSTKEMVASVLSEKYNVLKTKGNFNNEIGLPLTIFQITEEHEVAVLEMGISEFGEMSRLAKVARPDICVFTNIGTCHLENLNDRDGVLKAKTEVFSYLKEDGTVVLNGDDDKLSTITQVNGKSPVYFGVEQGGTVPALEHGVSEKHLTVAKDVENLGLDGIRTTIVCDGEEIKVMIPMPGLHNVSNALASACVGKLLGLSSAQIKQGIEKSETIAGRSHFIRNHGITIIDDCYNANPMSMKAALDTLAMASGRKIAVLGDMGELGENEKALHAEVGSYAAEKQIDALFLCGTLSKEMQLAAKEVNAQMEVYYFQEKQALLEELKQYQKDGDTILVKASHFMGFSDVVDGLV